MILKYLNSSQPIAAKVQLSIHDDESLILPLTPDMQEKWNRRAISNRRIIRRKLGVILN